MRFIPLLFIILLHVPATAQVVLGEADMPMAGDTIRRRNTNAASILLDQTGPDQIWDLREIVVQGEVADTTVTVGSTPFLYQFFFNNGFLFPAYVADYAVKGVGFAFQQLSLQDVYDYFRSDPDGFRNVGFGANVNGLPTSVRRQPVDLIHRFPMQFGNVDTSFSAFNITVPTLLYFGQDQVRINTVDGWGTLYLPADTFEVLRVRSVLQRTDTVFIQQFGLGLRLPEPETVEYKWLAPGMDAPVLQVTTTGGVATTARFFHDPNGPTGVGVNAVNSITPRLFPNPTDGLAYVELPADMAGPIIVMDALGREVRRQSKRANGPTAIDMVSLAPGTYTVMIAGDKPWSTKLVVH